MTLDAKGAGGEEEEEEEGREVTSVDVVVGL